jgi:cardiolipin synthase
MIWSVIQLAVVPSHIKELGLILGIIHLVGFCGAFVHILQTKREASAAILWIFLNWSFPVFGLLLYLGFGVDRSTARRKRFALSSLQMSRIRARMLEAPSKGGMMAWRQARENFLAQLEDPILNAVNFAFDKINPDLVFLAGNHVEPLINGDETYPAMLDAIDNARHHIHLQTFIFGRDDIGRRFMEHLAARARSGVKVRILYDRFGSTHAHLSGFFRPYYSVPNMEIYGFTQANIVRRQIQINLRNHRKVLVIDGKTGFVGGINIHNGHSSEFSGNQVIRDYHFKVTGPAVYQLQYSFLRDWNYVTEDPAQELLSSEHFPTVGTSGIDPVQVVMSGPISDYEAMADAFFTAISLARHSITIITPYFVPSIDIMRALRTAALRGAEVRVIVPAANNHFYVGLATRSRFEDLLNSGVQIFERHPPFTHAKAMLVDNQIALVGSANIDSRSFRLNHETNIAVLGRGFADRLRPILEEEIKNSDEVRLMQFKERPLPIQLAENLCWLLSPML